MFGAFAGGARPRLKSVASVVVACALAAPVLAQTAAGSRTEGEAIQRTEVQWLEAIQAAAQRLNYSGTIVYQRGGSMQTSRLVHYFDGSISHERLQLLDGKRREYIRRGTEVQCLYPDSRRVRFERRLEIERFPAIGAGAPAEVLERYRLVLGGIERVANTDCRVIVLEPRDELRYAHWLCVDPQTALLLKAKTLDASAQPLEQMAFAELRVGERPDRSLLKPSWSTEGWAVEKEDPKPADVEASGWQIAVPAGFRRMRAVARSMAQGGAGSPAMQVVYSDGLATLSVFIESDSGNTPVHDNVRLHGPVSGFARRLDDALITVIGEVPPATVRSVALSVTRAGAAVQPR